MAPTCEIVECSEPESIERGSISYDSLIYQSKLRYECDVGHEMTGEPVRGENMYLEKPPGVAVGALLVQFS